MADVLPPKTASEGDYWIPSSCSMCYGMCSILGRRVDGTLVKIEGNPKSACGQGRLCAKGVAGIMTLYDPNRVNVPLKRTNPEKGIGIDPRWVQISWDEALDIMVEKLKKVHEENPKKLFLQATTTCSAEMHCGMFSLGMAFGTNTNWAAGGGLHCGNGAHELGGLMHASWSIVPDFDLCNYALYFGCSKGHGAGHVANQTAQDAADARARGMKLVVVDPMCNFASGKATEWVPIRVGTDAALALAMANLLVNELATYDREYLKHHTNGPYLVGADGHYVRDKKTDKPLVWDAQDGIVKTFDDATVKEFAIEGRYTVEGVAVQPGFQILKDHLKKYTPEYASKITTIPVATIRHLAKEFGEAARIGSTIVINGKKFPYRPAAAIYFRGAQGHKNSTWNCLSIDLLNHLVGSADNAGGALGFNPVCYGNPETGRPHYVPESSPDGLMITGTWVVPHKPFPPRSASTPKSFELTELFPWAMHTAILASTDREEWWTKFKLEDRPEVMINFGANAIMSVGNKDIVADALKNLFIISFDIFLNEMTDFADIVLPDTSYLERLYPTPNYPFIFNHPAGQGNWSWPIRQPIVEPVGERRDFVRVLYEVGYRLGLLEPMNIAYNVHFELEEPYKLRPDVKYDFEEITDRVLKNFHGEEHGLEWFKEHGVMTWPKNPEEVYWRSLVSVRVPIYYEFFISTGEQVRKVAGEFGIENALSYNSYAGVPDWYPCPTHEVTDPQYDLISFYYRDTVHTNSLTMENPWLDEAAQMNPYSYLITIHTDVGKKKGLTDGDMVWVESSTGRRVKGRLKLSQGIHYEGLGVAALCGHWSNNQPIAKGKGVFFNDLIEIDYEHMDPGNMNMDLCTKVKIYKA